MALLTRSELKAELGIADTDSDTQLDRYVASAIEIVESICGPAETRACTDVVDVTGDMIALNTTPVKEVTSITGDRVGALVVSDFHLKGDSGVLARKKSVTALPWDTYTVVYNAGRASVPSAMKDAAIIIASWQWRNRKVTPARGTQADGVMMGGYFVPNAAAQAMEPHRRFGAR